MSQEEYVLQMKGITKRFPGVLAVDNVDLTIKKGEVLALVGENGAGKSTLMKVLSGVNVPDQGEILLNGKKLSHYNTREAIEMGISIIYQELNYYNDISIAENMFAGNLPTKGKLKWIDYKKLYEKAREYMAEVGLERGPSEIVRELPVAEKQLMEIAKAISKNIEVLVMDEPTATLNNEETERLYKIIKKLSSAGKSIIYISHRLDEVFEVSDRVMVMRDGKCVGNLKTAETSKHEIVRLMVGREIKEMYPMATRNQGDVVLELEGVGNDKIKDISFQVKSGEILGLFGLMGSGRTAIVEAVIGKDKIQSGSIRVKGKKIKMTSPRTAIRAGIGYVPAERKKEGLMLIHSVKDNITIAALDLFRKFHFFLDLKKEKRIANGWIKKAGVKTPTYHTVVESLSGGNQQKVVLAKWLLTNPKVLLLNEPTRGVDVGAKIEIYKMIEELCAKGLGIVMISSELPEIISISDRILTVHEGVITSETTKGDFTQERLLKAALGD